jgi:hypothetical protein
MQLEITRLMERLGLSEDATSGLAGVDMPVSCWISPRQERQSDELHRRIEPIGVLALVCRVEAAIACMYAESTAVLVRSYSRHSREIWCEATTGTSGRDRARRPSAAAHVPGVGISMQQTHRDLFDLVLPEVADYRGPSKSGGSRSLPSRPINDTFTPF